MGAWKEGGKEGGEGKEGGVGREGGKEKGREEGERMLCCSVKFLLKHFYCSKRPLHLPVCKYYMASVIGLIL